MFRDLPPYKNPFFLTGAAFLLAGSATWVAGADKDTGPIDRSFNAIAVCRAGANLVITGPHDENDDVYRFPLACTKSDNYTEPLKLYSQASLASAVDSNPRNKDTDAFKVSITYTNDRVPLMPAVIGNFPQASVADASTIIIDRAAQFNVALTDVSISEIK